MKTSNRPVARKKIKSSKKKKSSQAPSSSGPEQRGKRQVAPALTTEKPSEDQSQAV
jgi:hypothetical protein